MKLSELVAYRNELEKLSVTQIQHDATKDLNVITHLVKSCNTDIGTFKQKISADQEIITQAFGNYNQSILDLKESIDQIIDQEGQQWFLKSYTLYENEELVFTKQIDQVLNRRPTISDESRSFIQARVQMYNSWKHPGMIIRPGLEKFIEQLVMFDPLYILDIEHDLLQPAMSRFPVEYQKRLRPYVINELNNQHILEQIPNNQFGVCLVYNYFNFRPLEIIKQYLIEIYQKLKPGGTLLMTFNDCDRDKAVMLVEMNFASYTPGKIIQSLAESIGYETAFKWNDGGPSTWLELRKPGELTSLRGGQTLAKIIPK